jgi:NTP pyrophosphatase (non-canonical NTP hydrolase)
MTDIQELQERIAQFSKERDWDQFHNGKDLAIGLSIEASELLEAFLWKAPEDVNVEKVKEELADVFNYALQIATKYDLDVKQIVEEKLAKNAAKYPVEKAKGVATKYDEL